jgi:hypothetical protein
MEIQMIRLPVFVEPLSDRPGYVARLGAPSDLSAEAATPEEAVRQLTGALHRLLDAGARVFSIPLPLSPAPGGGGWLPDDDLTREWLQAIQEYRQECDEADRRRILGEAEGGKAAS